MPPAAVRFDAPACAFDSHALQNGSSRTSSSVLISISSAFPHIPALPSHACISIIDLSFLSPSTAQSTCRFQAPIQHDGGSACAHPPPGPGVPTAPGPMGSDARRTPANTAWRWQRRRRCGLAVPHHPSVRRGALDPTASRNRFHGAGHVVGGVHRAELSHARSATRGLPSYPCLSIPRLLIHPEPFLPLTFLLHPIPPVPDFPEIWTVLRLRSACSTGLATSSTDLAWARGGNMTAAGFSAALGKCLDEGRDPLCEDVIWAMGALRRSSLQCLVRTAYRRHCVLLQDRAGRGRHRGGGR